MSQSGNDAIINKQEFFMIATVLKNIRLLRFHLHHFYHEALSPEIPSDSTASLKAQQVEKAQRECKELKDSIVRHIIKITNSSNEILQQKSDLSMYKNERAQESYLRKMENERSMKDIESELELWDRGEVRLEKIENTLLPSILNTEQYMEEKWDRADDLQKHIAILLKLPNTSIFWNKSLSRFELILENFMAYIYVSDRRKLPIATSLPDQLRKREEDEQMSNIVEEGDNMVDEEADTSRLDTLDGEAFVKAEALSEYFVDHVSVLAHHENPQYQQISNYAVFRNIQKQMFRAIETYSSRKYYKKYLIQSLCKYIISYRQLYSKEAKDTKQLLNSKLLPPSRSFNTYYEVHEPEAR